MRFLMGNIAKSNLNNANLRHVKDVLCTVAFVALLGLANALATNAGDYAAPTQEEIDADIEAQRVDLCDADGWPDDENSRLAFRRACHTELKRAQ
ncbi:hypothetical protein V8G57_02730 [Collimonas sp. H4R21]|uniref:Conjugative transfer region protein TrbK n=1 Tax=Collimonas rhizosphaerae TaxID=3126357 RepID=A0ABU9PQL2_9BURK